MQRKDTAQQAIQLAAVHTLLQRATQTAFVYVNHNIGILDPISSSSSEGRSRSSSGLEEEHSYYADLIEKATGERPPTCESDEENSFSADTFSDCEPDEPELTEVDIRDGVLHELLYGCGPYLMATVEGKPEDAPGSLIGATEEHAKFASYMLKSARMWEYDNCLSELVMHDKLDYSCVLKGKSIKHMLRKAEEALADTESELDSSSGSDSPVDRSTQMCTCVVCAKWPGLREQFGRERAENPAMDRLCKAALDVMEISDEDPIPEEEDFRKLASSEDE